MDMLERSTSDFTVNWRENVLRLLEWQQQRVVYVSLYCLQEDEVSFQGLKLRGKLGCKNYTYLIL